jgi:hypothetical protein
VLYNAVGQKLIWPPLRLTWPHRNALSQVYPGTLSLNKYLHRRPTDAVFPSALCSFILSHPLLLSRPSMSDNPRDATNPVATINSHSHDETVTPVPEKGKARASWQDSEEQILPENRLRIVFPGLMCCIFLAALDQVCSNLFCQSSLVTDCRFNRLSLLPLYPPSSSILAEGKTTAGSAGPSFVSSRRSFPFNPHQFLPPRS